MNSKQKNLLALDLNQIRAIPRPISFMIQDWGLLEVRGPDREKFLQGQATCDLGKLTETGHLTGAFCSPKGRALATFRLFAANDSIYLRMPRDLIKHIQSQLQRYAAFFDLELHYAHEMFGIALLADKEIELAAGEAQVLGSMTQVNSAEIWGTQEQIEACKAIYEDTYLPASPDWWEANLISSGEAQVFSLTSERFLAHQLSLDLSGAVSFRKGCYTGQEIVARTQYRGKSKKRLAIARLQHCENFFPGTEIVDTDNRLLGNLLLSTYDAKTTLIQAVLPEELPNSGEFILGSHRTAYELIPAPYAKQ